MAQAIASYVKNIAVFIIFMSFVGIITPDGKYKDYINVTLGFILIIILISPIGSIINGFAGQNLLTSEAQAALDKGFLQNEAASGSYNEAQTAQIIAEYKTNLAGELETLVNKEAPQTGLYYESADFNIDESDSGLGNILSVTVGLTRSAQNAAPTKQPFIRVESVNVDISIPFGNVAGADNQPAVAGDDSDTAYIKNKISDFYNLSIDNIYINVSDN